MTFKRVILAVLVVGMAIAPVAHAENAPTCADEHLTGADCQGADVDPSADGCEIKVWVGKASCDLVVPDGAEIRASIGARAWADQPAVPQADLVIRDKATGTVLMEQHLKGTPAGIDPSKVEAAVSGSAGEIAQDPRWLGYDIQYRIPGSVESQVVSGTWGSAGGNDLGLPAGTEVTCEVTGTHSRLGAATATAGDTPNVDLLGYVRWGLPSGNPNLLYDNGFACDVRSENPVPPPTISPGSHGCVARYPDPYPTGYLQSSCIFYGEPSGVPSGVVSATTGTFTVSHEGPSGTVVDIAGSGPGAMPFTFTQGVLYRLTVNGDGVGAVTAGSPE